MVPAASSEGPPAQPHFSESPTAGGTRATSILLALPVSFHLQHLNAPSWKVSQRTCGNARPTPTVGQTPSCVLISTASASVKVEWGRPAEDRWFESRRFEGRQLTWASRKAPRNVSVTVSSSQYYTALGLIECAQ